MKAENNQAASTLSKPKNADTNPSDSQIIKHRHTILATENDESIDGDDSVLITFK